MSDFINVENGETPPKLVQVPIDDMAFDITRDGSGNILTTSFTYQGYTYTQTYTYTGSYVTGISQFLVQP